MCTYIQQQHGKFSRHHSGFGFCFSGLFLHFDLPEADGSVQPGTKHVGTLKSLQAQDCFHLLLQGCFLQLCEKVNSFHISDNVINLWDFYKRFAVTMSTICPNTLLIAFWVLHQAVLTENNLGLLSAADNKPIPENNIKRGWLPSEGEGARVRRLIRWKRHFFPNQESRGGGK